MRTCWVRLDLPRRLVLRQVVLRTVCRRLLNGNSQGPLWTVVTDPERGARAAWAAHGDRAARTGALHARRPELPVVRLRSRRDVRRWVAGPVRSTGG